MVILGIGGLASNRVDYRQIDAAREFERPDCTIRKPFGFATIDRERTATDGTITKTSQEPQHFEQYHTLHMLEEGWTFCPLCLREITEKDRSSIAEVLTHLLNKEAEEFNIRLNDVYEQFTEIKTDMPEFPGNLNKTELHAAVTVKEELNKVLTTVREKIENESATFINP